jgi:hypothetical protein
MEQKRYTPLKVMNTYSRLLLMCVGLMLALPLSAAAAAASKEPAKPPADIDISSTIIKNYTADKSVTSGMIVGYKSKDKKIVVPLTNQTSRDMLGVVVPVDRATFTLTGQAAGSQQVLVAQSGDYPALVSTQGGAIKSGDYLTMSALPGIAMKSTAYQENIVGTATANFDGKKNAVANVSIKNSDGKKTDVTIGSVSVDLRLAPNPTYVRHNSLPGTLTTAANAVANKAVSLIQIYLSLALLTLTFFVVGIIFYGAVRSSIISIGRNPLSKQSVVKGLIKVLIIGLIILGAGLTAAYLVLKF